MTDITMRARIARAIAEAHELHGRSYYSMADAVLAAMRQPTAEMVNAGYDVGYSPDPLPCDDVWRAMIDAAISEGKND